MSTRGGHTTSAPSRERPMATKAPSPSRFARQLERNPVIQWARANPDEVERLAAARRYERDPVLVRILQTRGDYGKPPTVASRTAVNDAIADGGLEWYHGFASANGRDYAQQFMAGNFAPGRGTYGSGFYTGIGAAGLAEAHQYTGIAKSGEPTPGSVIMRGAIPTSARVYRGSSINRDIMRERASFEKSHPNMTPEDRAVFNVAFGDLGWFAALRGYDAVGGRGEGWGLIVNPAAVIVQRSLIAEGKSPSGHVRNSLAYAVGKRITDEGMAARAKGRTLSNARMAQIRREVQREFAQREDARLNRFIASRDARRARTAAKMSQTS